MAVNHCKSDAPIIICPLEIRSEILPTIIDFSGQDIAVWKMQGVFQKAFSFEAFLDISLAKAPNEHLESSVFLRFAGTEYKISFLKAQCLKNDH